MDDIYALGAVNGDDAAFMIARYEDDDAVTEEKEIKVNIPKLKNKSLSCFVVNKDKNEAIENILTDENGCFTLIMQPNCCILIEVNSNIF